MKVVHADEVSAGLGSSHRGGISKRVRLFDGEEGSPGNFSFGIAKSPGRYSPRHRHNFEQFRYQLAGNANYGKTGTLKPGVLGFFPEGVRYGPQTQEEGEELQVLVLQFGGVSGNGYLGRNAQATAADELRKFGTFKNGVFRRDKGMAGRRNQDAFEAIWEHVNQRPLVYPRPRYEKPVLMMPENFDWVSVTGAKGVYEKNAGLFTEGRCGAEFLKLESGAKHDLGGGRDLYFILRGTGRIEGQRYRTHSAMALDAHERAGLVAEEETEMLHFRLPDLAAIAAARPDAEAAE